MFLRENYDGLWHDRSIDDRIQYQLLDSRWEIRDKIEGQEANIKLVLTSFDKYRRITIYGGPLSFFYLHCKCKSILVVKSTT